MNLSLKRTTKTDTERIAELVGIIRELTSQESEIDERIKAAREELSGLVENQPDRKWNDDLGYAMLTADSERVTFDAKALDVLLTTDPDKYGFLTAHKKVTTVKGSLRVK